VSKTAFEMMLESELDPNARLRGVKSPLPGSDVQDISVLVISRALDERLNREASLRGVSIGELIARALETLERR
jgi:hypothetical protein